MCGAIADQNNHGGRTNVRSNHTPTAKMEAKSTLSDINVTGNFNWYDGSPLAVQAVLRKISKTELARARHSIAEEVGVILTRVNTALYGLRLANTVLEEENGQIVPASDPNERERRNERLEDIQNFLKTTIENRSDLSLVLESLQSLNEDFTVLEEDETFLEVRNITGAWVARKDAEVWKSMSNIEAGVLRLRHLCTHFFNMKAKKPTKRKLSDKKAADIWFWWRETRVDARMLLKIQERQPPSTERMLSDAQLGDKAATDLSFMLEDMAKLFAQNKAMNIAFQFAQTGLSNLSQALKEKSQEAHALHNEVDRLQSKEMTAEMEQLVNKLKTANTKVNQLIQENNALKGNNAQLLKENEELKAQAPVEQQYFVEPQVFTQTQTQQHHEPSLPPTLKPQGRKSKQGKVKMEPQQPPQITKVERERSQEKRDEPATNPRVQVPVESELPQEPGLPESPESPKSPESSVPEEVIVFEEVEKKSKKLLSTFQEYVFDLVKSCLGSGMPAQLEKMGLDPHKTRDAMQLYLSLQNSLRTTFEEIVSSMKESFSSGILDLPVMDEHQKELEYFDNSATPGQMLQEIVKSLKTCDDDFENVTERMHKLERNSLNEALDVCQQLHTIHNKGKEQSCKMRLVWESLVDVYNDVHSEPAPKVDTEVPQHFQKPQMRFVRPLAPVTEKPKTRQLSQKEVVPPKMLMNEWKGYVVKIGPPLPFVIPQIDAKPFSELLDRYEKEMVLEGEKILRYEMREGEYHLSMESQLTNLGILHQALLRKDISTGLYSLAKELIKYSLSINEMRLACFMRKFIAHHTIQNIRTNLNVRVLSAREYNDGAELRDLYIFLTKLERYKNSVMQHWRVRRTSIEDKRRTCLAKLLYLFRQFELDLGVTLVKPHASANKSQVQRFPSIKPQLALNIGRYSHSQARVRPCFTKPELSALPQPQVRELSKPKAPATWSFNITMDNMQLASKQPVVIGVPPTFPRLLEIDISHSRQRALRLAQARYTHT